MICLSNGVNKISKINFEVSNPGTDFYRLLKICKDILLNKFDDKNGSTCVQFKKKIDGVLEGKIKK